MWLKILEAIDFSNFFLFFYWIASKLKALNNTPTESNLYNVICFLNLNYPSIVPKAPQNNLGTFTWLL